MTLTATSDGNVEKKKTAKRDFRMYINGNRVQCDLAILDFEVNYIALNGVVHKLAGMVGFLGSNAAAGLAQSSKPPEEKRNWKECMGKKITM